MSRPVIRAVPWMLPIVAFAAALLLTATVRDERAQSPALPARAAQLRAPTSDPPAALPRVVLAGVPALPAPLATPEPRQPTPRPQPVPLSPSPTPRPVAPMPVATATPAPAPAPPTPPPSAPAPQATPLPTFDDSGSGPVFDDDSVGP